MADHELRAQQLLRGHLREDHAAGSHDGRPHPNCVGCNPPDPEHAKKYEWNPPKKAVDQAHLEKQGSGGHAWSFGGALNQDAVDEVHNKDHFRDNQHTQDHSHDAAGRIHATFHDRRED